MPRSNNNVPHHLSRQQRQFLKLFEKDAFISFCAKNIGVSVRIIEAWRKESPLFAQEMEQAAEVFHGRVGKDVISGICLIAQQGNREAAKVIRDQYGKEALNDVMRGKILEWRGGRS